MIKKIPRYLKLHVEESSETKGPPSGELPGLSSLCEAFTAATGWPLRFDRSPVAPEAVTWMTTIGAEGPSSVGTIYVPKPGDRRSVDRSADESSSVSWPLARERFEPLAGSVGELLSEIHRLRHAIWRREAELATGIPVSSRNDERQHLAHRLEAVLEGGAKAIDCQAAALYLLDDATSTLKLRACWGLPKERLLDEPRPLRGAVADLEALVGHAVALEDTDLLPHWKVPEPFASAVCVPVSSPTNPLGTLWMFCDRPRDFTPDQTNLVEIVAGRLAADLEREVLLTEGMRSKKVDRQFKFASHWQVSSLPTFAPVLHGWSVTGWNRQAEIVGGDFYDWSILPDGMLSIAVGDAEGSMMEAALVATTVQISMKSHANYRHNAKQMVDRVNETLWTSSAGDKFASLFYAKVDCDNGHLEFCSAGKVSAFRVGARGAERINIDATLLGTQPESAYRRKQLTLKKGESLVIASEGTCSLTDDRGRPHLENALEYIAGHPNQTADEYVDAVGQPFETPEGDDRTLVIVKRHG